MSKITGAMGMGKGIAALTFDKDYQRKRQEQLNKQPANLQEGFARSGKGLVMGVVDGVTSVIIKPLSGAKEEGVEGFFKGFGKGVVGLVTRPTTGVIEFASGSFGAVRRATELSEKTKRELEKGKYAHTDVYVYHVFINKDVLLLRDKRLSYVEHSDLFGGWRVDWTHTWNEFSEPAKVIERGVQIFIKDASRKKKLGGLFGSADQSKILLITDHNIKQGVSEMMMNGWAQAAKLKGRDTSEGLIAVAVDRSGRYAVLAEINFEANLTKRHKEISYLTETMVSAVLNNVKFQKMENEIQRTTFNADNLKDLLAMDGKPLGDHTALAIAYFGQNIILSHALAIGTQTSNIKLHACTYPVFIKRKSMSFGRFGAVVAIKSKMKHVMLGNSLCKHIIHMNPQKIGELWMDEPHNVDKEQCIIHQRYFSNPSISVLDKLKMVNAEIVDFARFEVCEGPDEEPTLKST